MTRRLQAVDLCCGGGGSSMGLSMAGFDVIGVDIEDQPDYPFTFVKAEARTFDVSRFDFIWASPPCQKFTAMLNHGLVSRKKFKNLIPGIRQNLVASGKPYCIENVVGAPLHSPIMLCGTMFQLRVTRHRLFECSFILQSPEHPPHDARGGIRKQGDGGYYYRVYGHEIGQREWGSAMGISWLKPPQLAQAVPPAYSCYIAREMLKTGMIQ